MLTPIEFNRSLFQNPTQVAYKTHLNYIKRLAFHLSTSNLLVTAKQERFPEIQKSSHFKKLYKLTTKSLAKDIELAREDAGFAAIMAPWFPVKCYYALYYLESLLFYFCDGSQTGFEKQGHKGIRNKVTESINNETFRFTEASLNAVHGLSEIEKFPAIKQGQNGTDTFWTRDECTNSVLKKLTEYKLLDGRPGKRWTPSKRLSFINGKTITLIDFFYWYRIKANYRDVDFIDFENGVTEAQSLEYVETYYQAYSLYRNLLLQCLRVLINPVHTNPSSVASLSAPS